MPRVSTIIPCHDDGRWVGRAIESALAQDYPDHEVVVVDDGSTDETPQILARHADRVTLLKQPNRGPAAARNLGIRHAAGEYLAFLDADDRFLPHKLAHQVAALEHDPGAGLVYCDALLEAPDGRRVGVRAPRRFPPDGYLRPLFLLQTGWAPSVTLVRRTILERVGGFDESLVLNEDWELWMRIASASRVLDLREALVVKTRRPDSLGGRRDLFAAAQAQVTEAVIARFPDLAELRSRRAVEADLATGWLHLLYAEYDEARACFRRALSREPRNLTARRLLIGVWYQSSVLRRARRATGAAASPGRGDRRLPAGPGRGE